MTVPPLLKIFYVSRCVPSTDVTMVRGIVGRSQMMNRRADITGILAYTGHHFAQVLEGQAADLDALMRHIEADRRHEDVRVVMRLSDSSQRDFAAWSMHLLDSPELEDDIVQLMAGEADAGGALATRTLERIAAMVRWHHASELGPPPTR